MIQSKNEHDTVNVAEHFDFPCIPVGFLPFLNLRATVLTLVSIEETIVFCFVYHDNDVIEVITKLIQAQGNRPIL